MPLTGQKRKRSMATTKKSRKQRRTMRKPRIPQGPRELTLSVRRQWNAGTVTPSSVGTSNFWTYVQPTLDGFTLFNVSMGGLPNVTEYSALFDLYKLSAIKLQFIPRTNGYNTDQFVPDAGSTFRDIPYVSYIIDPRDATPPSGVYSRATYNNFTQLGKVKTVRADKPFSIYFRPLVTEQYGGGATRYVKPQFTLLQATGQSMPHSGVHMFAHNWNFATVQFPQFEVFATYYMTFKGMR